MEVRSIKGINSPSYHLVYNVTCQRSAFFYSSTLKCPDLAGFFFFHLTEILACMLPQCKLLHNPARGPCADPNIEKHQDSSSILLQSLVLARESLSRWLHLEKLNKQPKLEDCHQSYMWAWHFCSHVIFTNQKYTLTWHSHFVFVELGSWKHNSNHNREHHFIKNWLCAKLSVLTHLALIAASWHSLQPCFYYNW